MAAAVTARSGELTLESRIRDGGDCYFHALLVVLHFCGVLLLAPGSASAAPGGGGAGVAPSLPPLVVSAPEGSSAAIPAAPPEDVVYMIRSTWRWQ